MYIIHDQRIPAEAFERLRAYGTLVPFYTRGITHEALSGHPDIFFCKIEDQLVAAPNVPEIYFTKLLDHGITVRLGENRVGFKKNNTTAYNAVFTSRYLIHRRKYTDPVILDQQGCRLFIEVKQSFTRCSLIALRDNYFITSDKDIERKLIEHDANVFFVDPKKIVLPGFPYGLIGGCAGINGNKIFFIGSLDYHPEGKELGNYLHKLDYEIIELYRGQLFDGGGLFFMEA